MNKFKQYDDDACKYLSEENQYHCRMNNNSSCSKRYPSKNKNLSSSSSSNKPSMCSGDKNSKFCS